ARFQHFNDRNSKSGRLAGTGLGLPDDVEAIKRLGNEGRLDRSRREVAGVLESPKHGRAQVHRREPGFGFLLYSSDQSTLHGHRLRISFAMSTSRVSDAMANSCQPVGTGQGPKPDRIRRAFAFSP